MGSGITQIDHEMEDIIKLINSLEHWGTLFKITTERINNPEGAFPVNVLGPLIKARITWKMCRHH